MSTLHLVRHGQASFGSDDYDRLTPTGVEQCRRLAAHWLEVGRPVPLVYSGGLRRQRDSAAAFVAGLGDGAPEVATVAGLEEYDHVALVEAYAASLGQPLDLAALQADRRAFHLFLTRALRAWADSGIEGVEPFAAFRDRCVAALRGVMESVGRGRTAVVFGSAGSLAAAIQPIIGLGDWDLLRLKLNFYNTGVSRLLFNEHEAVIESLNAVPHLERAGLAHLITQR